MIQIQNLNRQVMVSPTSATNGATITSQVVDTIGYDYMSLPIFCTTTDTTTDQPSVITLQESDTTVASTFVGITAFTGGTTGNTSGYFVIPAGATATGNQPIVEMNIDLRNRKRYLRLLISPVTTMTFAACAELSRPEKMPVSTTDRNVQAVVIG